MNWFADDFRDEIVSGGDASGRREEADNIVAVPPIGDRLRHTINRA